FDLQFSIAQSPALGKFDPVNLVYGDPPFASDNHLFSFAHDVEGTVLKITVKRVDLPLYYSYDGRMRLIIKFDQDFVINGSDAGLVFQDYGENRIEDSQGYLYPGFYRTNTRAIRGLLP
ncbi:MAG: hypothetical protein LBK27_02495, partial [Treponema sp.]|nr:hypothetical protein [Treponema sp.]